MSNVLSDWSIAIAEIAESGKRVSRATTDAERRALAEALEILDCTALACDVRVVPLRGGRFHLAGEISADVVQACVVSLEPVAARIEEKVDVEFWPAAEIPGPVSTAQDEWFDPGAPDGAEPIENGRIGLGRIVYECVSAGLDPYPRKPGAKLAWQERPEDKASVHPFAALAKLKPKQ